MKIFQQIVEAVEKERFPKLQTLRMRSKKEKPLGGHLRLDDAFQICMENQPQETVLAVLEQCAFMFPNMDLPMLNKYLREPRQRYMNEAGTFSSVIKEAFIQMWSRLEHRFGTQNSGNSQPTDLCSPLFDVEMAKDVSVF